MRNWRVMQCQTSGAALAFHTPRRLSVNMALSDVKVPVLCPKMRSRDRVTWPLGGTWSKLHSLEGLRCALAESMVPPRRWWRWNGFFCVGIHAVCFVTDEPSIFALAACEERLKNTYDILVCLKWMWRTLSMRSMSKSLQQQMVTFQDWNPSRENVVPASMGRWRERFGGRALTGEQAVVQRRMDRRAPPCMFPSWSFGAACTERDTYV